MNTYSASGFHRVKATEMKEAAEIFANRLARKQFGRSGYCRICRLNSWDEQGRFGHYDIFIGYNGERGTTIGHNELIIVHKEAA
jgi:hypothetical protein